MTSRPEELRQRTLGNRASIYLCPPFVEEDMNMNTELLDDILDEIFEEPDSEDYNENESEKEEHETEDTERWADDGDLKKIPFEGNSGRLF
ncbi:hypothetical protein AVEN_158970-1 [Araneus ventricosus]|uniref:Uncharacterized protein n=1 Tax=Araneus ventricosus TaxID=182803 RepID=A0A4Y2B9Y7_ARAVE|nr:hypothetical protein AVEN_158970-1 [Araneus ventricosus]